jgi:hypothetical protein
MEDRMLTALESQRLELHQRWETLLRVEPVTSPLGRPEALKHMIGFTLQTLFTLLRETHSRRKTARSLNAGIADHSLCPCGRNPMLAYFVAGEQALLETLVLIQSSLPECADIRSADAQELKQVFEQVAHKEIGTFCAMCQFRDKPAKAEAAHEASVKAE